MGESSPNVDGKSKESHRVHLNAREKKRRDDVNHCFEALKQTIPCVEGRKVRAG